MIAKDELDLIVSGTLSRQASAIEEVAGRKLTSTELLAMGQPLALAMSLVAERSAAAIKAPPPAPTPARPRHQAQYFNPLATQRLEAVAEEDILEALRQVDPLPPLPKKGSK